MIRHTAALPLGFTVEFSCDDDGMRVAWSPDVPAIRSPRAWRKFRAAYNEARAAFLRDVAITIDGNVGVFDIDGGVEVLKPGTRH